MLRNKYLIIFIKVIVVLSTYSFIVYKLYNYKDLSSIISNIFSFNFKEFIFLFIVFVLMFFNWLTESFKWKFIIKKYEIISLMKSFKAVLIGISVALFTPNRIGEFGGRILVLNKSNKTVGILSTFIGSTSQLLVTIVLGSISLITILLFFHKQINLESLSRNIIAVGLLIISLVSIFLYFNIKLLSKMSTYKIFKRWSESLDIFSRFSKQQLLKILSLSTIRYIIFIIQFFLLFIVFHVDLNFYQAFLIITATYYIMAVIPSITFAELGIRGSVIIFFTEIFIPEFAGTLSASIILWIINLAIPAIIGSFLVFRVKK